MFNIAFLESIIGRGRSFTPEEVAIVLELKAEGLIPGAIAGRIG